MTARSSPVTARSNFHNIDIRCLNSLIFNIPNIPKVAIKSAFIQFETNISNIF